MKTTTVCPPTRIHEDNTAPSHSSSTRHNHDSNHQHNTTEIAHRAASVCKMQENHLYQYSILNALMAGVCETGVSVAKYKAQGTQGLGTFTRMDGELIYVDGTVYQLRAHGNVAEAATDAQIPYGVATNFVPQRTVRGAELRGKADLDSHVDKVFPAARSRNLYVSYRIEGEFEYIKYRTVCGQEFKGQPLSELADKQYVDEVRDITATIVGLRTPENWQGFGVAGQHLHFVDKDRKLGGHILEIKGKNLTFGMALCSQVHIEMPEHEDFNSADLTNDDEGIRKAEG